MKKTYLLIIGSILFWSCNNTTEKTLVAQEESVNQEIVEKFVEQEEPHYNEREEDIELNDGAKWLVNDEMKPFVQKGEELLTIYLETGKTDYKELAELMQEQNNLLIKSCTMTGKSHDELHKWLHPHLELVNALKKTESEEVAAGLIEELKKSNEMYHDFFE